MEAAHVAAVAESWGRVAGQADQAGRYFYGALFSRTPELRDLFPENMAGQRNKLLDALGSVLVAVASGDMDRAGELLGHLGRDHRRFRVTAEYYDLVGAAFLHTLAVAEGDRWTAELAAAWTEAYTLVAATMQAAAAEADRAGQPPYWEAKVAALEVYGDVAVVTVEPADPYRYRAGQSCAVTTPADRTLWRALSPANAPRANGTVEFHVRAVPGGPFSSAAVYRTRVGDVWWLAAPTGVALTVSHRAGPDLLLIGGGTGIGPLRAITEELTNSLDNRCITIVAGARRRRELYHLPVLQQLAREYSRVDVIVAVSDDPSVPGPDRCTAVEAAMRVGGWRDRDISVCGSPAMVYGTLAALQQTGYDLGRVHVEPYFSSGDTYAPLRTDVTAEAVLAEVVGR